MKSSPSARALSLSLLLLVFNITACSRDSSIAIPEANRRSLDSEGSVESDTPYESVVEAEESIEAEDSIAEQDPTTGENPEIEAPPTDNAPDSSETVPAIEDSPNSEENTDTPGETTDGPEIEPTPVAEAPPIASPKPSPVTKEPIENGRYIIEGVQSKKCIDVPAGGTTNGLQMQLWPCNPSNPNQYFHVEWVSEWKAYRLRSSTGKQLSISPEKINTSSPLVLADPVDANHTLFEVDSSGPDSTYQIRALKQLLVIDVVNRGVADGKLIQVFRRYSPAEAHQQWVFIKVN